MNRRTLIALAAGLAFAGPAFADSLPAPKGETILEITGKIANTNADGKALYDMDMLNALPQRTTVTSSPWYDGKQTFAGPLGWALLNEIGASGTMLKVPISPVWPAASKPWAMMPSTPASISRLA